MIVSPPCSIRLAELKRFQAEAARSGTCPHCCTPSLAKKHESDGIHFLQCSRCLVVIALAK